MGFNKKHKLKKKKIYTNLIFIDELLNSELKTEIRKKTDSLLKRFFDFSDFFYLFQTL